MCPRSCQSVDTPRQCCSKVECPLALDSTVRQLSSAPQSPSRSSLAVVRAIQLKLARSRMLFFVFDATLFRSLKTETVKPFCSNQASSELPSFTLFLECWPPRFSLPTLRSTKLENTPTQHRRKHRVQCTLCHKKRKSIWNWISP